MKRKKYYFFAGAAVALAFPHEQHARMAVTGNVRQDTVLRYFGITGGKIKQ